MHHTMDVGPTGRTCVSGVGWLKEPLEAIVLKSWVVSENLFNKLLVSLFLFVCFSLSLFLSVHPLLLLVGDPVQKLNCNYY